MLRIGRRLCWALAVFTLAAVVAACGQHDAGPGAVVTAWGGPSSRLRGMSPVASQPDVDSMATAAVLTLLQPMVLTLAVAALLLSSCVLVLAAKDRLADLCGDDPAPPLSPSQPVQLGGARSPLTPAVASMLDTVGEWTERWLLQWFAPQRKPATAAPSAVRLVVPPVVRPQAVAATPSPGIQAAVPPVITKASNADTEDAGRPGVLPVAGRSAFRPGLQHHDVLRAHTAPCASVLSPSQAKVALSSCDDDDLDGMW